MLKTRVITAVILLAILIPIFYAGSVYAFLLVSAAFFGAAIWENQRLFRKPAAIFLAMIWTLIYLYFVLGGVIAPKMMLVLFAMVSAFWLAKMLPSLKFGLPAFDGVMNGMLSAMYTASIFACFVAIYLLFSKSPLYLFSSLAVVWIADIGAYFCGKAFGKHKLAPSISPGKTWEGAMGGAALVILTSSIVTFFPVFANTLPSQIMLHWGWLGLVAVMVLLSATSVCGDLFESQLKRRAEVKDSSHLLPGHGGVLDRIDALIPVMPLVALLGFWW